MANTIQFKRRVSGNAGAPAALKSGEVAHNEVDDILYVGKGDDGAGNATSIQPLAGKGGFVDLSSAQTIAGKKTFATVPASSQDAAAATDLVRKSQFDSGLAAKANTSHGHAMSDVTGLQSALDGKAASSHTHAAAQISDSTLAGRALLTAADAAAQRTSLGLGSAALDDASDYAAAVHGHTVADVTGMQSALDAKAPLASPVLTGAPTAPTPAVEAPSHCRGSLQPSLVLQEAADGADLGGERDEAVTGAPRFECLDISAVTAHGRRRIGALEALEFGTPVGAGCHFSCHMAHLVTKMSVVNDHRDADQICPSSIAFDRRRFGGTIKCQRAHYQTDGIRGRSAG